ncbi:MAG: choice-of-anchor D domain-containing protein [Deltaproteobacteria bacterium]|nr:choice-of-anchor D domain-containing protein [Deltaproteobacteria bacterium]
MSFLHAIARRQAPWLRTAAAVCRPNVRIRIRLRQVLLFGLFVNAGIGQGCDCGGQDTITQLVPKIEVTPAALEFGQVPLGARKRLSLHVRNVGTGDLTVSALSTEVPFSVEGGRSVLRAGEQVTLDVRFDPTSSDPVSAALKIETDDPENPTTNVGLSGVGVAGTLTVAPSEVSFVSTRLGTERVRELLLTNTGIEDIAGEIVPEGFDRPEHFALSALPSFVERGTFGVPALSSTVLDLTYRPLAAGEDPGRVRFEFCGERCGVEVVVDASASAAGVRLVPAVIDFGAFAIGEKRTQPLLVENSGAQPVQVTAVTTRGGSELSVVLASALPATIEPEGSMLIRVELTPSSAIPFSGEVVVATTDAVVGTLSAEVLGEGQGPLFLVTPSTLAFGVERSAGVYTRKLLLLDGGSQEVFVGALTMTGDPAFSVSQAPGLPARLGAGESVTIDVAFAPTEVTEYAATLTVASDDPEHPSVEVPITGAMSERVCELELSPERVNFGLLPPTFVRRQSATLTNMGTDTCRLLSGSFRAPLEPAISLVQDPFPVTVAPGGSLRVDFQYAPTEMAEAKARYVILTDDPVFPERPISILGSSEGYVDIYTKPEFIDFGPARPGCTVPPREVRVFNAGSLQAFIESITLTSTTTQEVHVVTKPTTPAVLPSGGFTTISVDYAPTDVGADDTELEIKIRDLPYPFIVPLHGEGVPAPQVVDAFEQEDKKLVDVLFVIDDSCSMYDDQNELAANFARFIAQASVRKVDFRIGITTTTLEPVPGMLRGDVLSSNTPDLDAAFRAQAAVGVAGSGIERGLDAMRSALTLAAQGTPPNAGLLRDDAGLVVVIVSDEDDQSSAPPLLYYNDLRGRPDGQVVTAMITGGPTGCFRRNGSQALPAPDYETFRDLSGGVGELICGDWAQTLANVGDAAFTLRRAFSLSRPVDTREPVTVRVNGALAPTGAYTFDTVENRIVFGTAPVEGSIVTIEFTPACL